jgi:hypothetical protein
MGNDGVDGMRRVKKAAYPGSGKDQSSGDAARGEVV